MKRKRDLTDSTDIWITVFQNIKDKTFGLTSDKEEVVNLDDPEAVLAEDSDNGLLFYMCVRSPDIYLLLLKLVDAESGTFQRIGVTHVWDRLPVEAVLEGDTEKESLPRVRYKCGLHSIRII